MRMLARSPRCNDHPPLAHHPHQGPPSSELCRHAFHFNQAFLVRTQDTCTLTRCALPVACPSPPPSQPPTTNRCCSTRCCALRWGSSPRPSSPSSTVPATTWMCASRCVVSVARDEGVCGSDQSRMTPCSPMQSSGKQIGAGVGAHHDVWLPAHAAGQGGTCRMWPCYQARGVGIDACGVCNAVPSRFALDLHLK